MSWLGRTKSLATSMQHSNLAVRLNHSLILLSKPTHSKRFLFAFCFVCGVFKLLWRKFFFSSFPTLSYSTVFSFHYDKQESLQLLCQKKLPTRARLSESPKNLNTERPSTVTSPLSPAHPSPPPTLPSTRPHRSTNYMYKKYSILSSPSPCLSMSR